ncbi:MAG TPA: hypothetical protein VGI81_15880 [Tepidisphaeraceae bacterium]|jgi:hypothetical protein
MLPTPESRRSRIDCCISDLSENGINVITTDDRHLGAFVREHLDYFQMMLGYDSDPNEVLELIKASDYRH